MTTSGGKSGTHPAFRPRDPEQIVRLVDQYPLAMILSGAAGELQVTPLPMLVDGVRNGQVTSLLGHFGRSNPHVAALQRGPRATAIFKGPHSYVSPALVNRPAWAPTWNYALVRFEGEIEFAPEDGDLALTRLVNRMERDSVAPWTPDALGARYAQLKRHIIAFRLHVRAIEARFKLGQDEDPADFERIVANHPDRALAAWMRESSARPSQDGGTAIAEPAHALADDQADTTGRPIS